MREAAARGLGRRAHLQLRMHVLREMRRRHEFNLSELWRRTGRTSAANRLVRLNREIKRRTDVVGVFPDDASVVRLVGAVLMERADEWEVERRPFSLESMRKLTAPEPESLLQLEASPMRLAPIH